MEIQNMHTITRSPTSFRLLGRMGALVLGGAAALVSSGCGRAETPGNIIFSWVLVKASNPNPDSAPSEDCKQVGVDKIRLEIGSKNIFDYPCAQNSAQSQTVTADTYHVRVSALGLAGNLIQSKEFPQTYVFGATKLGAVRLVVP
jgi:hypothetical protein